jgi:hypothetical protein
MRYVVILLGACYTLLCGLVGSSAFVFVAARVESSADGSVGRIGSFEEDNKQARRSPTTF